MLARCPTCRATFSTERSGQQTCPACGKPLIVPEQPVLAASLTPDPSAPRFGEAPGASPEPPASGTPWERRPELPLLQAWKETMTLALFEPNKLFALARLDKLGEQTTFALLTFSVFSIIGQLLGHLMSGGPNQARALTQLTDQLSGKMPAWFMNGLLVVRHHPTRIMLLSIVLAPLVAFLFLYANAAVTHLCAMVFGQNRRGFDATFAACAYAMAPTVLVAIPACGGIIALVWTIVLTGIGLKRTHGISTGGATAATLGPYLVFCCLICALFGVLASFAASTLGAGLGAN